jgi:hypothetical protein
MGLVSAASNPAEIFCARIRPALEQADFEKKRQIADQNSLNLLLSLLTLHCNNGD